MDFRAKLPSSDGDCRDLPPDHPGCIPAAKTNQALRTCLMH